MQNKSKTNIGNNNEGRIRRRFRRMMKSKTGQAVGVTSLVAPIIGLIINDLRRPDSISRQLIGKVVNKLTGPKYRKIDVIDITDEVEISDANNQKRIINN